MKIQSRTALIQGIGLLIPLIIITFFSYFYTKQAVIEAYKTKLNAVANIQKARIEAAFQGYFEQLNILSRSTHLHLSLSKYIQSQDLEQLSNMKRLLTDAKNSLSGKNNLFVVDNQGETIVSSHPTTPPPPSWLPYQLSFPKNQGELLGMSKKAGAIRLILAHPLKLGHKSIGTFILTKETNDFDSIFRDYSDLGLTGETMVAFRDQNGDAEFINTVRFAKDQTKATVIPHTSLKVPITLALQKQETTLGEFDNSIVDYRHIPVLAATRYIPRFDWGLVVKADKTEIRSTLWKDVAVLTLVSTLAVLFGTLVAFFFIGVELRRLLRFRDFLNSLGDGDLSKRFSDKGDDEITEVVDSTNSILEEFQDTLVSRKSLKEEIARREETEHSLRNSNATFSSILNTATVGIVVIDQRGTIILFNPHAEAMFGIPSSKAIGENVKILMGEPYRSQHDQYLLSYLESGIPKRLGKGPANIEARRASGEIFPIELRINAMKLHGEPHFHAFLRDISQESALRGQLEQVQYLDSLGRLSAGIAHEINSPLWEILLTAERICRLERKGETTEVIKAAEDIIGSVEQVSLLVESLKKLSRKAPQEELKLESITQVFGDILRVSKKKFELAGITLHLESSLQPGADEVWCNRAELTQIALNLLNNAFDAVKDLETKWVFVKIDKTDDDLAILIQDSGTGIPPSAQDKIFELFFTTKEVGEGTGLGLALCRALAMRNNLSLYYDPKTPHTTFVLRFENQFSNNTRTGERI